jgi:hypothetical protein
VFGSRSYNGTSAAVGGRGASVCSMQELFYAIEFPYGRGASARGRNELMLYKFCIKYAGQVARSLAPHLKDSKSHGHKFYF